MPTVSAPLLGFSGGGGVANDKKKRRMRVEVTSSGMATR